MTNLLFFGFFARFSGAQEVLPAEAGQLISDDQE
jgi:hypothetical protein